MNNLCFCKLIINSYTLKTWKAETSEYIHMEINILFDSSFEILLGIDCPHILQTVSSIHEYSFIFSGFPKAQARKKPQVNVY